MKSFSFLKPYLRKHIWLIAVSSLLALPLAALRAAPAPLIKKFIDNLSVARDPRQLAIFPALVVGIYVLNFVVRFFHFYLIRSAVVRIRQEVVTDLFRHLLGLSADHFTLQTTGTLISRVGADPQYIDGAILSINILVREPLTFIALLAYAMKLNWKLTVITFGIFPALAWLFRATGRNLKRYAIRLNEENASLFSTLQESFTGVRIVKLFGLEDYVWKKFSDRMSSWAKFQMKAVAMEEASHPMVELLTSFVIALIVFWGGRLVLLNHMTTGDLMAFFVTFGLMVNPIRSMNEVNVKITQAAGACVRIAEIFSWNTNVSEPSRPVAARRFEGHILVESISFAYPDAPSRHVIRDVSFELPAGRSLALVGPSGSGKSSIASLIPRVFDVDHGSIRIDGIDVRRYSLKHLRDQIAVVSQDVFLFNDTVEENIRCGHLEATRQQIHDAARRASALEFIQRLPDGFDTIIGDRGQKLSGGERQRLSIARAFLRQAPILILDEATSSLDSESERYVQSALSELMFDKTTLVVAHRLSTIRNVDQILVIKDGRIAERGSHTQLIGLNGEYARLYQTP